MIDPTNPAVLDVHDFRRAGEMRQVERALPAPEGIANPVITVPGGADVAVGLLMESVIEGVLVSGTVTYPVTGECSRCLDPLVDTRTTEMSELYLWHPPEQEDPDAEPMPLVQGGFIDLSEAIRDAIVLDLPLAPVCDDDCPGLCPQCGARLVDDPDHDHPTVDPRWQALADWQEPPDEPSTEAMRDT